MSKRKYPPTAERVGIFTAAWREIAPEASFAGMTLAEFETNTAVLAESQSKLQALEAQTSAAIKARDEAETLARRIIRQVGNAVRADLNHGEDSPLYRAMGYVPESERQSGLTRRADSDPAAGEAA